MCKSCLSAGCHSAHYSPLTDLSSYLFYDNKQHETQSAGNSTIDDIGGPVMHLLISRLSVVQLFREVCRVRRYLIEFD